MVSASAGWIVCTTSTMSAVSAKDWPIACSTWDGRKSSVAHWLVRLVAIRQAMPIRTVPNASTHRASTRRSSAPSGSTMTSWGSAIHNSTAPTCSSRKFCTVCR